MAEKIRNITSNAMVHLFLKNYKPDVVIVMNPVYSDEIKKDLANMNLNPEMIECS